MKRGGVALLAAALLALAASAAVFLYLRDARQQASTGGGTVTVIVSKEDIPAGSELDALIDEGTFTTESVLRDDLLQGAVTDVYQLRGQRVAYPILAGEQISVARLQGQLQAPGGLLGIPSGFEAMTVTLEPQRVVAGAIQKGDHVVVYGTFTTTAQGAQLQETRTLVPDVQVLAVNAGDSSSSRGSITITLALKPLDAGRVIYAQEQGHVWLALLPPNERGVAQPPVTFGDLP